MSCHTGCKPSSPSRMSGVSLIELMVAVAIVGILAAVAIPMFSDYGDTACEGLMATNMETIRLYQEDYRLSEGSYAVYAVTGTLVYNPSSPEAANGMYDILGWGPRKDIDDPGVFVDEDNITYTISAVTASGFTIAASSDACGTVTRVCTTTQACTR